MTDDSERAFGVEDSKARDALGCDAEPGAVGGAAAATTLSRADALVGTTRSQWTWPHRVGGTEMTWFCPPDTEKSLSVIKPERLSTPLSIPPPEGALVTDCGCVVVGLLGGMVTWFRSGSHVFGIGSIFLSSLGPGSYIDDVRGMGGGQRQMSRPKWGRDSAQFMLMLGMLRERPKSAGSMDANYR